MRHLLLCAIILVLSSSAHAQYHPLDDYNEVMTQNAFGRTAKCATRLATVVELSWPGYGDQTHYDTTDIKRCISIFDSAGRIVLDSCGGKSPTVDRYYYDSAGRLIENIQDWYWQDVDKEGPDHPAVLRGSWNAYRRFAEDNARMVGPDLYRYRHRARYSYDSRDSLLKVEKWFNGQIMEVFTIDRDKAGRIKRTVTTDPTDTWRKPSLYLKVVTFRYDKQGRLETTIDDHPSAGRTETARFYWSGDTLRMATYSNLYVDTIRYYYTTTDSGRSELAYSVSSDSNILRTSRWTVWDKEGRVVSRELYAGEKISEPLNVMAWRKEGWTSRSDTFWLDKSGRPEYRSQYAHSTYVQTEYECLQPKR